MKTYLLIPTLIGLAATAMAAPRTKDIVIADFEGSAWPPGWTTTGTAFGNGPAHNPVALEVANYVGGGVASSEQQGDTPVGTLTSAPFRIERRYVSLLIAGGRYPGVTCANLLVDGKAVCSATTPDASTDRMARVYWDVKAYRDKMAQIQLVDNATGDWGHINVDQIVQTDVKQVAPTQPLYHETYRPQFHFTGRQWTTHLLNPGMRQEGWINDVNGLIYYEGEWHLFTQRWARCWVHAVSTDLIHWTELQPAFWDDDKFGTGVQSGTCVIDYHNASGLSPDPKTPPMVAFWSGFDNNSQCISYSLDKGRTWTKYAKNPLFLHRERDPKVFWHEPSKHFVMVMYGDDAYHILTSTNLLEWKDEHNPIPQCFECPDMFEMALDGDHNHTMWALVRGDGKYSLGQFDGRKFTPTAGPFPCDYGENFYATQTWNNTETGDGRRIQIAWMRGGEYPDMPFNQQHTFPHEMTLRTTPEGPRIFFNPIKELELLHGQAHEWNDVALAVGAPKALDAKGGLYRIQADLQMPEGARLVFNLRGASVVVTRQSVSCNHNTANLPTEVTKLEVLVDRTSVEVFINGGEAAIARCFLPETDNLSVVRIQGAPKVKRLRVIELKSIWK